MIKSLFRLSLRMVTGFMQSLVKLSDLDWTAPNYSKFKKPLQSNIEYAQR